MTQDLIKRIDEFLDKGDIKVWEIDILLTDLKSHLQEAQKQNELACQIRYNIGRTDGICEAIKTRERMG